MARDRGSGPRPARSRPSDDWIDIAVLGEDGETVLFLERRRVRASPAVFEIVVGQQPARVVIDPYYKLIDRNRGDNVRDR